ncbi:MAG: TlpA family protein disulfide reductase [Marinilabiliaceae bacterium]|nr:TlpA family protein disulfide reductase [Marinilabiliaceae bacterium]
MNYKQLEPYLHNYNDTTYVINFWATWCKPCIEELPVFLKLANNLKTKKIKFIFVSLDFPKQIETSLIPFIQKQKIKEQVILLNDTNSNYWIEKVDSSWSGAIPATLIYKGKKKVFREATLTETELLTIINTLKNEKN